MALPFHADRHSFSTCCSWFEPAANLNFQMCYSVWTTGRFVNAVLCFTIFFFQLCDSMVKRWPSVSFCFCFWWREKKAESSISFLFRSYYPWIFTHLVNCSIFAQYISFGKLSLHLIKLFPSHIFLNLIIFVRIEWIVFLLCFVTWNLFVD